MDNTAMSVAQKILDELSEKGLKVGDETILKCMYESLQLNCNQEFTEGSIGAMFFLIDGINGYAYVIGRQDDNPIGHKFGIDPKHLDMPRKIAFSYFDSHNMKTAWVEPEPDCTVEEMMLEMKNIVADVIRDIYKSNWNPCTKEWEKL